MCSNRTVQPARERQGVKILRLVEPLLSSCYHSDVHQNQALFRKSFPKISSDGGNEAAVASRWKVQPAIWALAIRRQL